MRRTASTPSIEYFVEVSYVYNGEKRYLHWTEKKTGQWRNPAVGSKIEMEEQHGIGKFEATIESVRPMTEEDKAKEWSMLKSLAVELASLRAI